MIENYDIIKNVSLFQGIGDYELDGLLRCLKREYRTYKKSVYIFSEGDDVKSIGIVLSGNVQVQKQDVFGRQIIMADLESTEIFGEVFAFANVSKCPVYVQALSDCKILFLDFQSITGICHSACAFHKKLIENMLRILAEKNMFFHQKVDFLSKRTIRERVSAFLESQIAKTNSREFTIAFTREAMADYLCVDRSALSRELGKMRNEGILTFERKNFHVLKEFK